MSRYRPRPTPSQENDLAAHCAHARYVWNPAVEQHTWWTPRRGPAPGFALQCRQLSEARAGLPWLRSGSVGWVRFRLSRPIPAGARSYRIKKDRAGRWHIAFTAAPESIPAPGNGEVVGVDRGVAVSAALSTGDLLTVPALRGHEARRLTLLQRRLSRCRRGSKSRRKVKTAIARLTARGVDRRKDWVEKTGTDLARRFDVIGVEALNIRGMADREARESQARFPCRTCGYTSHADTNAARNIKTAAGQAVAAREEPGVARLVHREPQLVSSS